MLRALVIALVCGFAAAARAQADEVVRLSLKEAEQQAAENHPRVRTSHYSTLASGEVVRQTRSVFFPTVLGSFTGAGAQDGTRIAAGGLNNPTILDRFAAGVSASQLLTDFGRTSNLVAGQVLRTDAAAQDETNRRAEVILDVDRAYYDALRAQAVLKVAEQTVAARQLIADQVTALAASGLKSGLDVSFARVSLSQAQLLLAQARGDVQASYANLTAALGSSGTQTYELQDVPMPELPADDAAALIAKALDSRSDVAARRLSEQASSRFAAAEHALRLPSVSLVGAAGFTPYHQVGLTDRYSAMGVTVTIPLANGNLLRARQAEAGFRQQVEEQGLRELVNRVARDVTVASINAKTAYQRVDLTNQLLAQATDALELAQGRYDLGLSSIVELSQAQLNKTQAEIEQATARYEYQARMSALDFQVGARR